jgi:hypothetical protein
LSDNLPTQNGLKQGGASSPLLFKFALKCAIRKVWENRVGMKLNGTHQLLVYADDVNLLEDNIYYKGKHRHFDASKEVCPEVKAEKTKHMLLSRHQNAGQNDIKITSFENVAQLKYFQFNSIRIYLCANLTAPEANYKVCTST